MDGARLDELLRHPAIWRAAAAEDMSQAIPTGFRRLDARLPGGGWLPGTLIELLVPAHGLGELRLLIPTLRELGAGDADPRRWIAWLGPPYLPYAPALASAGLDPGRMLIVRPGALRRRAASAGAATCPTLWAMEQALRSRACAAALGWVDVADARMLRRLKLAAEESGNLGVLFRPARHAHEPSPASLRLLLETRGRVLDVVILKCQGGTPGRVEGVLGD